MTGPFASPEKAVSWARWMERFTEALGLAREQAKANGDELPLDGCFCSSCQARHANLTRYLPREFQS